MPEQATISIGGKKIPTKTALMVGGGILAVVALLRGGGSSSGEFDGSLAESQAQGLSGLREDVENALKDVIDYVNSVIGTGSDQITPPATQIISSGGDGGGKNKGKISYQQIETGSVTTSGGGDPNTEGLAGVVSGWIATALRYTGLAGYYQSGGTVPASSPTSNLQPVTNLGAITLNDITGGATPSFIGIPIAETPIGQALPVGAAIGASGSVTLKQVTSQNQQSSGGTGKVAAPAKPIVVSQQNITLASVTGKNLTNQVASNIGASSTKPSTQAPINAQERKVARLGLG